MTDEKRDEKKRPYAKRRRAELEAYTRQRITESTVELHGTLGPAHTSISAVAEHAGVRRSTVYRHFPDEVALFAACTSHWMSRNQPPDPARWAAIDDRDERLRFALQELYGYYRRTEQMMSNLHRDEATMSNVRRFFAGFREYLAGVREILMRGRPSRGAARRRERAAVGHALAFPTWRSLALEEGLDDAQASDLMCHLVAAAGRGRANEPTSRRREGRRAAMTRVAEPAP